MVELLVQVLSTFALVLGVAGGEIVATKAFGGFKRAWLHIVEIVLFVIGVVVVFNLFSFTTFNAVLLILTYFIIGFILIVTMRGIMTGAGVLSEHVKEKVIKVRKEKDYILGLKKALERRGFDIEDIIKIAKEIGYNPNKVDDVLLFFGYKTEITRKKRKKSKKRVKAKTRKITKKKR